MGDEKIRYLTDIKKNVKNHFIPQLAAQIFGKKTIKNILCVRKLDRFHRGLCFHFHHPFKGTGGTLRCDIIDPFKHFHK